MCERIFSLKPSQSRERWAPDVIVIHFLFACGCTPCRSLHYFRFVGCVINRRNKEQQRQSWSKDLCQNMIQKDICKNLLTFHQHPHPFCTRYIVKVALYCKEGIPIERYVKGTCLILTICSYTSENNRKLCG